MRIARARDGDATPWTNSANRDRSVSPRRGEAAGGDVTDQMLRRWLCDRDTARPLTLR